jgi:hypothetical protein
VKNERDAEQAVLYRLRCLLAIVLNDMKRTLEEVTGGKFQENLTLNRKLVPSLRKVKSGALEEFTKKYGGYKGGEKAAHVWVDEATEWIGGPRSWGPEETIKMARDNLDIWVREEKAAKGEQLEYWEQIMFK